MTDLTLATAETPPVCPCTRHEKPQNTSSEQLARLRGGATHEGCGVR
ncbi:hypothetical protein JD76_01154 [Micromonospora endolithica]|nr:hypothetical protein JD76_01154 [Micromonospora endolithica]